MSNPLLRALDRAVSAISAPANSTSPPRRPPTPAPTGAPVPIRAVSTVAASRATPAPSAATLAAVPFASPPQQRAFDAFLRKRGWSPDPHGAKQLSELDGPWTRLQTAIAETRKNQSASYHAHLADIAARTAAGDSTVKAEDGWSREDWQDDADERCRVFKAKCKEIEHQAWELARPVLLAKADACDAAADELATEAKGRFDQFAVPFSPPPYVLLLRKYAAAQRDDSRRIAGLPSSMIENI